jgi:hypothetical protein
LLQPWIKCCWNVSDTKKCFAGHREFVLPVALL